MPHFKADNQQGAYFYGSIHLIGSDGSKYFIAWYACYMKIANVSKWILNKSTINDVLYFY